VRRGLASLENRRLGGKRNYGKGRRAGRPSFLSALLLNLGSGFARRYRSLWLEPLEDRAVPAFIIIPTFASNITSDPNAALIMASINRVILGYENTFADNITVNITFQEGSTEVGSSSTAGYIVPYSSYRNELIAHATSADDTSALLNVPSSNPIAGTLDSQVRVASALANVLGLDPGLNPDSTITLNTSLLNLDRTGTQDPNKYDLIAVAAHEIDEALTRGSGLDGLANGASISNTRIMPSDLFRYEAAGVRSYNTNLASQSFFSIDGGNTMLAQFNQTAGRDYADWYSPGDQTPQVQDAVGTKGARPNLNVELRRLDILGYTRFAPTTLSLTPPAIQSPDPGVSKSFNLGSINNGNGPFAVTVNWGDGSANSTFYVNNTGSLGAKNHTYASAGIYTPTISVADFTSQTGTTSFTVTNPPSVTVDAGNVVCAGTIEDDPISLAVNGAYFRLTDPNGILAGPGATQTNSTTVDVLISSVTGSTQINGNDGNDTLTLDLSGGNPFPSGGINFNGGNPTTSPGDKLVITGGSQGTVTYTYTNAHDGKIVMSNFGTLNYTGLEPITNSGSATDVVFNLPSAASNVVLEDSGTSSDGIVRLRSSNGTFETTAFANPSGTVTINRGSAADTFTVNNLPSSEFSAGLAIGSAGAEFNTIFFGSGLALAADKNLSANATGTIAAGQISVGGTGTVRLTTAKNISLNASSSITSVDGSISLSANQQATPTAGTFAGVLVNGAMIQATGAGAITIKGTGGNNIAGAQHGVDIQGGATISGGTGGVQVTGTGIGGTGGFGVGVAVTGASVITAIGNGPVIVQGTGGSGQLSDGVLVSGIGTSITSSGGPVQVTGQASSASSSFSDGVRLSGHINAGGSGTVTIQGTSASTIGGDCNGIEMQDGAGVQSSGGNVVLTGHGGGSLSESMGIYIVVQNTAISVSAGGSGSVTLQGTGGSGSGDRNYGIETLGLSGKPISISSNSGNIQIAGTGGGSATSGTTVGVRLLLYTQIAAGGAGNVTIQGTGGSGSGASNNGFDAPLGAVSISSSGGSVQLTGVEGGGSSPVGISGYFSVAANGGGVTLAANSMALGVPTDVDSGSASISTSAAGSVTIKPYSTGVGVDLGSTSDPIGGPLSLSDAELDCISAGTLKIGDSVFGGPITISAPINVANNTTPIPTLHLLSHGAIVNNSATAPAVTATNLAIESQGGSGTTTTLTTQASNLAASYVGGYDLNLSNTGDLTVTNVDGVNGGTGSTGGGMSLTTAGNLTISAFTGSTVGPTQITAAGVDKLLTINSTFSGLGDATITADKMAINATVNFGSSAKVILQPYTNGAAIDLGSATDAAAATLELSSAELAKVVFANLQVGNSNSGPVSVSADITRSGNLGLTGAGGIDVSSGTINTSGGNLAISGGATFGKSGTDANLTSGTATGALSFAGGSFLRFAINGKTVDLQYQQLNVTGGIDLTGEHLLLTGAFSPSPGDKFILVNNDNSDAVTGTFFNLPEGTVFDASHFGNFKGTFQITYQGGDGNDVVITAVDPLNPVLQGTPGDDSWDVSALHGVETIDLNGMVIAAFLYPLSSLTINGLAGNDTLNIALVAGLNEGNPIPSGGLTFNGGMPTTSPGDKLIINGGGNFGQGRVTYDYTNSHDGSITMSEYGKVNYTGLEPIINNGSATDIVFDLPSGPNTVTLGDDGTSGNGLSRLSASTIETTDFANPSGTLTINRGNSTDAVTLNALPDFNAGLTLGAAAIPFGSVTFADALTLNADHNLSAYASGTISLPNATSAISTSGAGSVCLSTSRNISIATSAAISTVEGGIKLLANQQATKVAGNFSGISVSGSLTTSGNGGILVSGTAGADATTSSHRGVDINGGTIKSTGTAAGAGKIIINGTGGAGTDHNSGVVISAGDVESVTGDIQITGLAGNGSTTFNRGVAVLNGGTVESTGTGASAAAINLVGTGGPGTDSNMGVEVFGTGSVVSTVDGDMTLNGTGGASTGSFNYGFVVFGSGQVNSTGTGISAGTISISGTAGGGGTGTTNNIGTRIEGAGTSVTSVDGDMTIVGNTSTAAANAFSGVNLISSAAIQITGNGSLAISGTGGVNGNQVGYGLRLSGSIAVAGPSTTLRGDAMFLDPASLTLDAGTGTVIVQPLTNNKPIDLGTTNNSDPATLGLPDVGLDLITAGTLQVGAADSGPVTISADITRTAKTDIAMASGGAISFSGGLINTGGGNLTLAPGSAGVSFPHAGVDLNLGATGKLSFAGGTNLVMAINGLTADTQYDQLNVVGSIDLTGVNLALSGTLAHAIGNQFTLISNDGADDIAGSFANLSGNLLVIASGPQAGAYAVNYAGGDNNDLVLTAVNTPPTFAIGATASGEDEDGATSIHAWATNVSAGPPDESTQKLQFIVDTQVLASTNNKPLFAVDPAIDPMTGDLTFRPVPNVVGSAVVTLQLMDNGGTDNGGVKTSQTQTFTIEITKTHVWHNAVKAEDVNGDNQIAPNDLTALISFLNGFGATDVPKDGRGGGPYGDVDADGVVAPKDLSRVIIYLNSFGAGEGESSSLAATTSAAAVPSTDDVLGLLAADVAVQSTRRR
jgi:dockerin type I repeat protein